MLRDDTLEKGWKVDDSFQDLDRKVIVVDSSGGSRNVISDLLKPLGVKTIQGMPGIKELISMLEVESATWILTSAYSSQPTNLLQLLKLVNRVPSLRKIRVSAFIEPGEVEILPAAFENGLMSYHMKPFTKDGLLAELTQVRAEYRAAESDSTMVASVYLRKALNAIGNFEELLNFEMQLMKYQSGNVQQMMNLIVPMAKTHRFAEAHALIAQIKRIDPSLDKTVAQLSAQYLKGHEPPKPNDKNPPTKRVNFLNIKNAVVVDSDSAVQGEVSRVLQELGVETIRCYSDGRTAFDAVLEHRDNDLFIHEWRIPKLTGPLLLQKAKDEAAQIAPFVVYSSLIQVADVHFVREMGVTTVIPKPCTHEDMIKNLIWTVQQEHNPTEPLTMERNLRRAILKKDWFLVDDLSTKILNTATTTLGNRELIQAEVAFGRGQLEEARTLALSAFKNAGDSIFVLNLLGKLMTQLHELPMALKCYQKAQELAPHNLDRLCQIAELQSDLNQPEKSAETQAKVLKMDATSERLKETKAKIAIKTGQEEVAKKMMLGIRQVENVISYMNNLAVSLAQKGQVAEGIEQYQKTLRSLPVNRADLIAVVHYNLSLALIRAQRYDEALEHLDKATFNPNSKVQKKALSLIKRLHAAKSQGVKLVLQSDQENQQNASNLETNEKGEVIYDTAGSGDAAKPVDVLSLELDLRPGKNCVLGVYVSAIPPSPRVTAMLQGIVKFTSRGTIHKH